MMSRNTRFHRLYILLDEEEMVAGMLWSLTKLHSRDPSENPICPPPQPWRTRHGKPWQEAKGAGCRQKRNGTSRGVRQMFTDMGLTQTFSRPRTPNDNPFIESLFSTLKQAPVFVRAGFRIRRKGPSRNISSGTSGDTTWSTIIHVSGM